MQVLRILEWLLKIITELKIILANVLETEIGTELVKEQNSLNKNIIYIY